MLYLMPNGMEFKKKFPPPFIDAQTHGNIVISVSFSQSERIKLAKPNVKMKFL